MKTLAAVLYEQKKPLKIEELIIPDLKPGQVIVNIAYSGICHSQINEIDGLKGEDKFLPHTLGHEGSGIVEKIGENVKKVKPGDHVVLTWIKGDGFDVPCAKYLNSEKSVINSGAISTFLTKAIISENRLIKIPDDFPLKEASLLGCAIPTGAGLILNLIDKADIKSAAVFGVGGIGTSAILALKIRDCPQLIAVDINDTKLENAVKMGATHTINFQKEDVLNKINEITNGKGVDYAIEAAGIKEAMETAFSSVKDKGGLCIIAGNLPEGKKISINPFDLIKGKKIIGTWGGETKPDIDIPKYIDFYNNKKLPLEGLISKTYKFEEINEAIFELKKGNITRAVIQMPS